MRRVLAPIDQSVISPFPSGATWGRQPRRQPPDRPRPGQPARHRPISASWPRSWPRGHQRLARGVRLPVGRSFRASIARRGRNGDCSQCSTLASSRPLPSWRRSRRPPSPARSWRRPKRRGRGHSVGRVPAHHWPTTSVMQSAVFRPVASTKSRSDANPARRKATAESPGQFSPGVLHEPLPHTVYARLDSWLSGLLRKRAGLAFCP